MKKPRIKETPRAPGPNPWKVSDEQIKRAVDKAFQNLQDNPGLQVLTIGKGLTMAEPIQMQFHDDNREMADQLDAANELLQTTWNNWLSDDGDVHGTMSRIEIYLRKNKLL